MVCRTVTQEDNNINVVRPLPPELAIIGADSLLYRIGLSLFRCGEQKRGFLFSPKVIICCLVLWIIKNTYIAFAEGSDDFHLLIGDTGHFLSIRVEFAVAWISASILTLNFHLIHILNYWNGIEPIDLQVFRVLAGSIPPQYIGQTDQNQQADLQVFKSHNFLNALQLGGQHTGLCASLFTSEDADCDNPFDIVFPNILLRDVILHLAIHLFSYNFDLSQIKTECCE